ncbi:MAG: hypothetical protein APF77_11085 [Clostridia bacterium BRH_c25]|nr:MAG: hypothetical protein APF77_11085 [Clostridia bacterium BRH_c25]
MGVQGWLERYGKLSAIKRIGDSMKKYLFCCYREHFIRLYEDKLKKLPFDIVLLTDKAELTFDYIKGIDPEYIFFPDWSWVIPKDIVEGFSCICFHEAPLPMFRGGSPIQNQIVRGIKKTKLTAFMMDEGIDTGDILLQEDLSLEGHLKDISDRITELVYMMVVKIIEGKSTLVKQTGEGSFCRRRTPAESRLEHLKYDITCLYDFIRMLEDPYPNAYIQIDDKHVIFKEAELIDGEIHFKGIIRRKQGED